MQQCRIIKFSRFMYVQQQEAAVSQPSTVTLKTHISTLYIKYIITAITKIKIEI